MGELINGVLKAKVGEWLKGGNKQKRYNAIEPNDRKKMKEYFSKSNNPTTKQQQIWYNLVSHFGLRGRELLSSLPKTAIDISTDSDVKKFASINYDTLSKTVKASLSQKEFENIKTSRMYENPNEKDCPVASLEDYLNKIPPTNNFCFLCLATHYK